MLVDPPATDCDIDALLDRIVRLTKECKRIQSDLEDAKSDLIEAYAAGLVDDSFSFNDWSFAYSNGKTSTTLSKEAKKAIEKIKEADKAMGRAIEKTGAPFWTVKPPTI
jgi:hypothetical protein